MDYDSDNEESGQWGGSGGSVLLIDVSPPMWEEIGEVIPIRVALKSCVALIRQMMFSSPKHLIGISIFGTKKNDDQGLENVIQLLELKEPEIEDVTKLQNITSQIEDMYPIWGPTKDFSLANALWQASRMFSGCKKKMNSQTATILSCLEEPDPKTVRVTLKKAVDMRALGIGVKLINVSNKTLTADSFYAEFEKVVSPWCPVPWSPPEPVLVLDDLVPQIWQNTRNKRATALLKMYLNDDIAIGVGLYHLISTQKEPAKVFLDRVSNDVVQSTMGKKVADAEQDTTNGEGNATVKSEDVKLENVETKMENSLNVLNRSDVLLYQTFGQEDIKFTQDELQQMKKFSGPPCIRLLGFQSAESLDLAMNYLKPSTFLYPDETSVEGSSALFICLRDRCLALEKVAICTLVSRWYSFPHLVALLPQEGITDKGKQIQPDGFHVVYIPYKQNERDIQTDEVPEVSEEQVNCMVGIVKKLKVKYRLDLFENPKLQTMYSAIEALALQDKNPRPVDDTTLPDVDSQDERLGFLSDQFAELFGPFGESPTKRPASSQSEGSQRKKASTEDVSPTLVAVRIKEKSVDKFTVPQLKSILENCEMSDVPNFKKLKKDQLVELVYKMAKTS